MNLRLNTLSKMKMIPFNGLLLTVLLCSCHPGEKQEQKSKEPQQAADVPATEVFPLQRGRLSSSLQIPGELIAFQQVDLYAKENSFVKKLYVDVGSEVKAGQLLVTMEAPELGSQLAGALSNIQSREAIYTASKANYDRLYATSQTPGTISPLDLEQAAARKASDLAQLQSAKEAYQQIAETQNYLQIKAPFNGVITARNVNPGAYVGPSGKGSELPLFTLKEQKKLRLVISVPEAYTSYLSHKNEISFTVKSMPDQQFKAHINRMAGALDNKLHAQRIEMDVENNDKKLLPGMVAEVNLPLPANDSTFIVPKSAVVNSTEKVFVIRAVDSKAEWVNVKTGRANNDSIEIYGSLHPGDQLLKAANEEIRNGSALKKIKQ
ncbi:efflux RND transporter periplasmic adaptor subunit [Flavihumibacter profundi]|uniref:efflux RND transporter periplasmic adaptor subunit n=1 Tax=Flavihumibacter profundi TaxID=2716883 RepID=UPI001CC4A195|nr:efflux RND transporter periplasmic adaptor subunit [Flavihumibacter profundi]MBZ5857328.1 efflux RND transporter periplasmic adaptor subunit [Flavihumibacter profundi]